jgi:hypothetical protein
MNDITYVGLDIAALLEKHSRFRGGQVGEEARHQAEEEKRESAGKDGSSTTPRSRPWPVIWPFTVVLRKPPVWPTYSSTDVLCNQRSFSPTPLIRVSGNSCDTLVSAACVAIADWQ